MKLLTSINPILRSRAITRSPIAFRPLTLLALHRTGSQTNTITIRSITSTSRIMSFSNADTGSKPADPYTAKNKEETSVKEKVEDLVSFVDACKFGMMTTKDSETGGLVSRCMAVAAKVSLNS